MSRELLERALALVGRRPDATSDSLGQALHTAANSLKLSPEETLRLATERTGEHHREAYAQLVSRLTVGETYLFRHPEHFELLATEAGRRRAEGRPFQTAWSVGCSTGEEAYSLALTLLATSPDIRVLGTDVSLHALEAARSGRYRRTAFRDRPPSSVGFVQRPGNLWQVSPMLQERVEFHELNLAQDAIVPAASFPRRVDVVFCRNVLIYFPPELQHRVVPALASCVAPGGLLLLGSLEWTGTPPPACEPLPDWSANAFRKQDLSARSPVKADSLEGFEPFRSATRLEPTTGDASTGEPRAAAAAVDPRAAAGRAAVTQTREDAQRKANVGDLRGALALLRPYPDDRDSLALSSIIHEELGDVRAAELGWRRVLLITPGHVEAHLRLALLASRTRDAQELQRWRTSLAVLMEGLDDATEVGSGGLRAGYVRAVLATLQLGPEVPR